MKTLVLDLLNQRFGTVSLAILLGFLCIAALTDLLWRRIPNWLTMPGALVGMMVSCAEYGLPGAGASLFAFMVWFWLGFMFYRRVGGIGAGDIKLIMACAALLGLLPTLYVTFAGFALQVMWLVGRWVVQGTFVQNLRALGRWLYTLLAPRTEKVHFVAIGTPDQTPYAPFLLVGTVLIGVLK